ncbi:MAG: hypothetical protein Kow0010_26140 [Dehalococcoidia bacterium]
MSDGSESLIPDETRAMVGQVIGEPVTATITAEGAHRYAQAVDDLNPLYFDEEHAKAAGYRTMVCPPTYIAHAVVRGRPLSELRPDGLFRGGRRVAVRAHRVMFGGEAWEFLAPVYIGDTVTATTRFVDVEEKQGRSGPFVLMTNETTYTNQDGTVVAKSRQLSIAR